MKDLMPKIDRDNVIEVCNRWLNGNLTAQEIRDTIGALSWAVIEFVPELDDVVYASHPIDILVCDILEMDSISDEEKDKAILWLVEEHKEELQSLAKRVIVQLDIDTQEFTKETKNNGYCSVLAKKELGDE